MLSRTAKRSLLCGGVLILSGILVLVDLAVELSPWVCAGFLAGAGLAALGLFLTDRTDGPMLLAAYVLGAVAGLVALVPPEILRDEAVAYYVLLSIALPFLGAYLRNRARWWALIPAYSLLAVVGVITLSTWGRVNDDLITAYVLLAVALPFLAVFARNRKHLWALAFGGSLAVIAISFATWLPWHSVRESLVGGGAAGFVAALALLIGGAQVLVRTFVRRGVAR